MGNGIKPVVKSGKMLAKHNRYYQRGGLGLAAFTGMVMIVALWGLFVLALIALLQTASPQESSSVFFFMVDIGSADGVRLTVSITSSGFVHDRVSYGGYPA